VNQHEKVRVGRKEETEELMMIHEGVNTGEKRKTE
jgi:hypothetical protein